MAHSDDPKKTSLFDIHRSLQAKMVPFGGWMMPVSYTTVLTEHKAVREACGVFDVSHMGEIFVRGPRAEAFVQHLTMNDVQRLQDGGGQYSALLYPHGGMVDDIIVYRLQKDAFLLCVNAGNIDKDAAWLEQHARDFGPGVTLSNDSSRWSQLAVQGPRSLEVVRPLLSAGDRGQFESLEYMQIMPAILGGQGGYVARTGYTGEWGYELYVPNTVVARLWEVLMSQREHTGLCPIGLGARDTLRLEACYNLYGNDMDDQTSPLESGIAWAVRLDAGDFIGRDALLRQKESGVPRQLHAFVMEEDGIPRHGMSVLTLSGESLGTVTSGSVLPSLSQAGGLVRIASGKAQVGDSFYVDIRGKRKLARLVKKPLYKAKTKG